MIPPAVAFKIANERRLSLRILVLAAVLVSFKAYHVLNVARDPLHVMVTAFDRALPLVPAFSVPYLLYFPFLFFTVIDGILRSTEWKRIALSIVTAQTVACLFYFFYQTHVPRPELTGTDIFTSILRFIYDWDQPYNTFPSLHTAHTAICAFWWRRLYPRWSVLAVALLVAIMLATVLLKQHVLADVLGGIALAAGSIILAERVFPRAGRREGRP
jgi:membrane-associated phospholipid phosphatase